MIQSFKHKGLKSFYLDGTKKGVQPKHAERIADILDRLEASAEIGDMSFPGSNLHLLEPKQENRWAVSVSGAWRITFVFERGDAYELDYEQYH